MNITEIKKMSTSERLQVMEVLWDSFRYENDEIETPQWHAHILKDRKKNCSRRCKVYLTF